MAKKLGEILIERGLITHLELEGALKAQLIFGGHLGTSLIELGYLDEDALGRTLAEIHRLPFADRSRLGHIPGGVLGVVPRKFVERYQVVPIGIDRSAGTLDLAVVETRSIGPLSSTTGFRIVPWIAPETCILEAMERWYGIPRRPRYISLERQRPVPDRPGSAEPVREPVGAMVPASVSSEVPTPEPAGGAVLTANDIGEEFGYGKSWREVAGRIFGDEEETADPEHDRPAAGAPRIAPGHTTEQTDLARAADLMSRAETKDDLARAVLDYTSAKTARCVLFAVKKETARVWDWRGLQPNPERVRTVRFPVTSGSVFTLLLGNSHYRGAVTDDAGCRLFYAGLGMDIPLEVLLLPIYLQDRLVAILYGDGGRGGRVEGEIDELLRLGQKFSLALNMLVVKMRIRAL